MIYLDGDNARQFHATDTAIALGKFDGIHVGHRLLIDGLCKEQTEGKTALVFSFGNHPNAVLSKKTPKNIYTTEEKIYYFESLRMDVLLEYPFTREFAGLMPEEFVRECLVNKLGMTSLYVGEDFRFGRDRRGDVDTLRQLGERYHFDVCGIPQRERDGKIVSSTLIREALSLNIELANELLGSPYFIYGEVLHGKHLGTTIGFPTVNQEIPDDKMTPRFGVYESRVSVDGITYPAISNLGVKPTIAGTNRLGVETHILDYAGDLYGRKIKTELLSFIREEMRFESVDALKEQIRTDILQAEKMTSKNA